MAKSSEFESIKEEQEENSDFDSDGSEGGRVPAFVRIPEGE